MSDRSWRAITSDTRALTPLSELPARRFIARVANSRYLEGPSIRGAVPAAPDGYMRSAPRARPYRTEKLRKLLKIY
jgi:hypothetical protein